jgi:hypothetical protein
VSMVETGQRERSTARSAEALMTCGRVPKQSVSITMPL